MKKIGILCLTLLMLVGCSYSQNSVEEEATGSETSMNSLDDSYYKIINLGGSELRERFYTDVYSTKDFDTIGRDLQILSAKYFPTSSYYMSEGQYFGREEKYALIRRSSEYSIQPKKGTTIDGVESPVMISNIHEQDYYVKNGSNYVLKGVSLAIIVDPTDSLGHTLTTPMSDITIKNYGKGCIEKVYDYIQKTDSETVKKIKNLPILITIYQATDKTRSTLNGKYIYESYCEKQVGSIIELDHANVILASDEAEKMDKTTSSEFGEIKNILKNEATEAAGLIGEAKYIDGEIQSMIITANLNIKTITELQYLTSIIADNIESKFTYDFDIKVLVYSQDGLKAIIIKEKGQDAKSHMLY